MRELSWPVEQRQTFLRRGSRLKAAWRASRKKAAGEDTEAGGRDLALSASGAWTFLVMCPNQEGCKGEYAVFVRCCV